MSRKIDTVFVLVIFCIFAGSVMLVIMLGGGAYANINEIANENRDERILLSYIRTKIRNTDTAGAVSVGEFHGINALFLQENIGGRDFITKIYLYNGAVHELFFEMLENCSAISAGGNGNAHSAFCSYCETFLPADGAIIIRTDYLRFSEAENGLLQVCTPLGSAFILPRSER